MSKYKTLKYKVLTLQDEKVLQADITTKHLSKIETKLLHYLFSRHESLKTIKDETN